MRDLENLNEVIIKGDAKSGLATIDGSPLDLIASKAIIKNSRDNEPVGSAWGKFESGSHLALAILLELVPMSLAWHTYRNFASDFISSLRKGKDFKMTVDVQAWISSVMTEELLEKFEEDYYWERLRSFVKAYTRLDREGIQLFDNDGKINGKSGAELIDEVRRYFEYDEKYEWCARLRDLMMEYTNKFGNHL